MRLLLTSAGISTPLVRDALVRLLGRPVEQCRALLVPTAILPFPGGPEMAARLVRGEVQTPLADLGWATLGVLDLTALPSIDREVWEPGVRAADALLFWGGDPLFLAHWVRASGLADLLPSLDAVWVGVSAGAMAACGTFAETYVEPRRCSGTPLTSTEVAFPTPDGEVARTVVTAAGAGLVPFAVLPHLEAEGHPDATLPNAELWAAHCPVPTYAIDDRSALAVVDGAVEVVSDGTWRLFPAGPGAGG